MMVVGGPGHSADSFAEDIADVLEAIMLDT